jgi:hypothetical protein
MADQALADDCSVSSSSGTTAITALIFGRYKHGLEFCVSLAKHCFNYMILVHWDQFMPFTLSSETALIKSSFLCMISTIFILDLEYTYLGMLVLIIAPLSCFMLLEPVKCFTIPDFPNIHLLYCLMG